MKLQELAQAIHGAVLVDNDGPDVTIDSAFAADLLSDVLSLLEGGQNTTLITGMVNPQVMRVAEILSIGAVIVVRGKVPPQSMVEYAEELGIPLITTRLTMFETCGIMYAHGVSAGETNRIHDKRAKRANL